MIGGFLAQPANKYRLLEFQLFCDYPYCFPCLVGAGLSMFSLLGESYLKNCMQQA